MAITIGFAYSIIAFTHRVLTEGLSLSAGLVVILAGFAYTVPMLIKFTGNVNLPIFIFLLFDGSLFAFSSFGQGALLNPNIYWLIPFIAYISLLSHSKWAKLSLFVFSLFFLYLIYHGPMLGDINPSERFFLTRISFVISSAQFLLFAWKIPVNPPKLMTGSVILLATSLIHSYFNFYHGYHIALSIIFLAIGFVYFGKYRLIPLAIGIGITLSSLFWAPIHSTQWVHQNWTLLNSLFILSMAYSLFLGLKMKNQMPSQFKEDPTESL